MKKNLLVIGLIAGLLFVAGVWIYMSGRIYVEKVVVITGKAQNVKNGAEVLTSYYGPVLINNVEFWPDDVVGKDVVVTGRVIEKEITIPKSTTDKNGTISQGTAEDTKQFVLRGLIKWELSKK